MDTRLRRQLWLLLIIAVVAYLWWDSVGTDRYGVIPEHTSQRGPLPLPPFGDELPRADTAVYQSSDAGGRISVRTRVSGDTLFARIETTSDSQPESMTEAALLNGYFPLSITQTRLPETLYVMSVSDSDVVLRRPGSREPATTFPHQHGALYDDLLILQIPAWKGISDSVSTELVSFAPDEHPVRIHTVTLRADGDSALTIHFGSRQTARVVFSPESRQIVTLRTAQWETFILSLREAGG
jgi:hypothetical protein